MVCIKILSGRECKISQMLSQLNPATILRQTAFLSDDTCKPKAYKEVVPSQALAWVRIWMECEFNPQ